MISTESLPLTSTMTVTEARPGGIVPPISKASTRKVKVASVPTNDS